MSRADFQTLLQRQPALAVEVLRVLNWRLHEADTAAIRDLHAKNVELARSYEDLKAAQVQIEVLAFQREETQFDDITLVVVQSESA